jgi:hypothetical protein
MQDPLPPKKLTRTCPACHRPVIAGDKFCEHCGTRVAELATCTKCGTQFVAPTKYCDLCGAPVVLMGAGPAGSPEPEGEEGNGPAEEGTPEPVDEDAAGPVMDEGPEEPGEPIVPEKKAAPRRHREEIQEPDTRELLELYGKEYDPAETLESSRKEKPRSPVKPGAGKPARAPSRREQVSAEVVDDALFLPPGKPAAPAKKRSIAARTIGIGMVLVAVIAAAWYIGLPMLAGGGSLTDGNSPAAELTLTPVPAAAGNTTPQITVTTTPVNRALVPQATQTLPTSQKVYFVVQKSPVTAKILVTFAGSAGHGSISSADIKVTHPDGSVATGMILPLKGITEIILDGSNGTDRVEILAEMSDGVTYRVYDKLVPLDA